MTRGTARSGENSVARIDFRNSASSGTKTLTENSNRNENRKKPMISQDAKQTVTTQNPSSTPHSKSRRKSTSSMPHSDEGEEGEYSDGGDSVQSLPIETTKTTSSLLSAPQNNTNNVTPPSLNNNSTLSSAENKSSSKKNPIVHQQLQLAPQQQAIQQVSVGKSWG